MADVFVCAGELEHGRQAALRALEIDPGLGEAIGSLTDVAVLEGRTAEALENTTRLSSKETRELGRLWVLAMTPTDGRSRAALDELIATAPETSTMSIVQADAMHGESDRAFEWLERARLRRDQLLQQLRVDPFLRSLHSDPRWKEFLMTLKLPVD